MRLLQSRHWCLIALITLNDSHARTTTPTTRAADAVAQSPSASTQTCRSGSVNYITQTLPQQCVASNRTAASWQSSTTSFLTPTGTTHNVSSSALPPSTTQETAADIASNLASTQDTTSEASQESSTTQTSASHINQDESSHTPSPSTNPTAESNLAADSELDNDHDSPLDTANFLSFEEWKRKNLEKAGQSPEHVGQQRSPGEMRGRSRPGINNALDVLGEDSEIELDFSGFGAASPPQQPQYQSMGSGRTDASGFSTSGKSPSQQTVRSKDAGRTCKERTNYASFDCAATVLKTNPECKSASSVLVENKDSYMLNICKVENKFFIVELCDAILIDTLVLANYEFFSSIFRTFRLSVSDRYPVKPDKWRDLGVFEAQNTRDVQAFLVEEPLIWARYLRIEILTHYGNQYYCPVSLLRVHGTTMMEEFRHQEELARGEYQEDEVLEDAGGPTAALPIPQEPPTSSVEADKSAIGISDAITATAAETPDLSGGDASSATAIASSESTPLSSLSLTQEASKSDYSNDKKHPTQSTGNDTLSNSEESRINITPTTTDTSQISPDTPTTAEIPTSIHDTDVVSHSTPSAPQSSSVSSGASNTSANAWRDASVSVSKGKNTTVNGTHYNVSPNGSSTLIPTPHSESSAAEASSQPTKSSTMPHAGNENVKRPSHTTNGAQPVPSTQESFFKSIHKRLQMLESNATLSLQYIEEQSRILRDAFAKVEKRQVRKTERFLESLNATVNTELQSFRTEYDQLWQSTVIELETHRRMYQQEMQAVSSRLNLVAEELLFQKRMSIVQSTLLVLCVALVLFHRAGPNALDLPILHQMLNKSPLVRGHASIYSPPGSPPAPSDKYRRSFWRRSLSPGLLAEMTGNQRSADDDDDEDEDEDEGVLRSAHAEVQSSPALAFQPPTPGSSRGMVSDGNNDTDLDEEEEEGDETDYADADSDGDLLSPKQAILDSLERNAAAPLETQSGPATPTGTRDSPHLSQGTFVDLTGAEKIEFGSTM